ncbi:MAG TPA: hypothetical protein VF880_10820, partial [Actinomycetes bacterium]
MARRIAGVGRVKVSERRSTVIARDSTRRRATIIRPPCPEPTRGAMPTHSETLEIRGHIIDSMLFTRILDQVLEARASYRIERFDVGHTPVDPSYA